MVEDKSSEDTYLYSATDCGLVARRSMAGEERVRRDDRSTEREKFRIMYVWKDGPRDVSVGGYSCVVRCLAEHSRHGRQSHIQLFLGVCINVML